MKNRDKTKEQLIKELEELWQTNEFFSLLLESMPVAIYTCEVGGDFGTAYISKNITALTGYNPEDFTSNSEFWFAHVHPDDQQMVNISLATLLETGNIRYEYQWRVADGSYKWFYDVSKLMKTSSGYNYIIGTFIDVTERKKTEQALKINEEKYRLLFLTEQDAIIIVNADTRRIVDANDAALHLYGYSKKEILELTGPDLSEEPDKSVAAIRKVAMSTDKRIHSHTRNHKKKDGTVFPVEISSGFFMLKDRKFISAVIRDISSFKREEELLRESEERFRGLVETTSDWIWEVDENAAYTYVSPKIRDILGYEPQEVLGKTPFNLMSPKEATRVADIFNSIAASQQPFEKLENTNLHKDGHLVVLETSGVPIINIDGKFCGYRGIDRNITDRKKAENKLSMRARELKESNIALKVLLKQRESDKSELEEYILSNIKHLIMPYIEKLKKNRAMSEELAYLNILESNLNEIISPFALKLSSNYLGITPKEIQIADLTRDGKQDKEISELLNISIYTVNFHKKNIRKKLGIYGKRTNLRTYLLSAIK
ncbi:MAG TPA: hypothetical protein DDX85_08735 [Nitrospiraceae bacterium]|nr:hypothetical protein [Nitrospiraceae bacterium]